MKRHAGELATVALFAAVLVWRAAEGKEITWAAILFGSYAWIWGSRALARRYALPNWSPSEAYITRLRRWRRDRQKGPASSRAQPPS